MATAPFQRLPAQQVSHAVITAAMQVHTELGPGLLESSYSACLQFELADAGYRCSAQVALPVVYRGVEMELGYEMDLVVEDLIVVENQVRRCHLSSPSGPNTFVPEAQWQIPWPAYKLQCCPFERRYQALCERNGLEVRATTTKDTKLHYF